MFLRFVLVTLLVCVWPVAAMAQNDPAAAWADFCDRMKIVGQSLLSEEYPGSPEKRADGFRHLARTVGMALQWEIDFADRDFPAFYRHNDDVTKWGGPNVDNGYLQARIRGDATYRLRGKVAGLHDVIISTRNGHMHQGKTQVAGDLDSRELGIGPDGSFEILLGPEVAPGEGIRIAPDTEMVGIRQFFYDWARETPGEFHLERVSEGPPQPEPLTPEAMVERLDAAARWVETSLPFWNRFSQQGVGEVPPNTVIPPRNVPGGSSDIYYGGVPFELEPDQALLIETAVPDARYWSFQWSTYHWLESPDFANRQTSLNGAQAHVDEDGKVRIVVSARDPGVQNWIDTAGVRRGRLPYRWVWSKDAPVPGAKVVPVAEVRRHLPSTTPVFDEAARRRQIAVRREHVERRFRR